jgi:hypothetical protein
MLAHDIPSSTEATAKGTLKRSLPRLRARAMVPRRCGCGRTSGPEGECAACRTARLGRQATAPAERRPRQAPEIVHAVLRSPGRRLDPTVRKDMEAHFTGPLPSMPISPRSATPAGHLAVGLADDASEREADWLSDAIGRPLQGHAATSQPPFDFGTVHVHTDPLAAASAHAIDALAYTVGSHIVFASGQYAPHNPQGRRLIAHELAHVIQQGGGQPRVAAGNPAVNGLPSRLGAPMVSRQPATRGAQSGPTVTANPWDLLGHAVRDELAGRLVTSVGRLRGESASSRFNAMSPRDRTFLLEYYTRLKGEGLWDFVVHVNSITGDAILLTGDADKMLSRMKALGYCADTWIGRRFHPNAVWSYREMADIAGMHLTLEPDGLVHVHFDIFPPDVWGVCHLPLELGHLADMFGRECAGDPECVRLKLCERGITIPGHSCPPSAPPQWRWPRPPPRRI